MIEKANYLGAYFSWVMDSYDLGAVVITASVLEKLFYPTLGLLGAVLPIVFTVVSRPLGGFLMGLFSDLKGRKTLLIFTVIGYSAVIGLTGILPTYYQIGILAPVLLSVLRFLQGIFIGGDVSSSFTLAMESIGRNRGLFSGLMQSGTLVGFVIVDLVFTILARQSYFMSYGWRIIFLIGIFPAIVAVLIRAKISESPLYLKVKKPTVSEVVHGLRPLLQTIGVMIGFWMMIYAGPQFVPVLLGSIMKLPPSVYGLLALYMNVIGILAMIVSGYLADKVGRRAMGLIGSVVSVVVAGVLYLGIHTVPLVYAILLFGFGVNLPSAITPAYLSERFKTISRATGVGFSYNGAFIIAGFSSIYISFLSRFYSPYISALIVFSIGSIIAIASLLAGPETLRESELTT
ncbi:MFS transporter [Sulfolobaceae archaeon RB850M]